MLVLASGSPRRRQLLKKWGVKFKIVLPRLKESSSYRRPHLVVQDIARKKALAIAHRYPGKVVLAADTIVVLVYQGKTLVIGKPKSVGEAKKILRMLSGSFHRVYTGVAVSTPAGPVYTGYAVSRVKVKDIPPEQVEKLARKHLDKAGAYAVQEKKDLLVEKIFGDYYNVVGLPFRLTRKLLRRAGITVE